MKHAIITCSDANCGDFLINNWLKSLKDNVNLENIDVVVIDYGLSKEHLKELKENNIIVYKAKKDGFPNAIKFRDILVFLDNKEYDQILTCDCADLIFQTDIKELLETDKTEFRAVIEGMTMPYEKIMSDWCFDRETARQIKQSSNRKRMINMGMIVAPCSRFRLLCKECDKLLKTKTYIADQITVNHLLYKYSFKEISHKYNFIPMTSNEEFEIKNGEFYLISGEKIAIVHNVGGTMSLRIIKNFGYGHNKNQLNKTLFYTMRTFIRTMNYFR